MKVPLEEIRGEDETFRISFSPDLSPLINSLRMVGQLSPLLVREGEGGYQLISGFKRWEAMGEVGIGEAEVVVVKVGDLEAEKLAVGHNLPQGMNLIEKARALEGFRRFGMPEEESISQWLPLFGLQPHRKLYLKLLGLLRLPRGLQEYIAKEALPLSLASLFPLLEEEAQREVVPLLWALRPGGSKLREIITHLLEVSQREGISPAQLLKESRGIWGEGERARPQRMDELRRWLRQRRLPLFSHLEERFSRLRASLRLPPRVSFHPPPFFEGEDFRIELRFRDREELRSLIDLLKERLREIEALPSDPLKELKAL